ncbi:MAG TPA: hypothetical protein VM639_12495 [Dongiaceae bacterium]|nr:hypothetical protein [Dongiaceae bacterium]
MRRLTPQRRATGFPRYRIRHRSICDAPPIIMANVDREAATAYDEVQYAIDRGCESGVRHAAMRRFIKPTPLSVMSWIGLKGWLGLTAA